MSFLNNETQSPFFAKVAGENNQNLSCRTRSRIVSFCSKVDWKEVDKIWIPNKLDVNQSGLFYNEKTRWNFSKFWSMHFKYVLQKWHFRCLQFFANFRLFYVGTAYNFVSQFKIAPLFWFRFSRDATKAGLAGPTEQMLGIDEN